MLEAGDSSGDAGASTDAAAAAAQEGGGCAQLPPPPQLDRLPRPVLAAVLDAVISGSSPASVAALALTCRALLDAVAGADAVWRRQCGALGWRDGATAGGPAAFALYSARMKARTRVRRQVKALAAFLPRRATAALAPGAPPSRLAAAEARLGVALPWELWELLRFRDGQDPGPGVALADDARLLGCDELFIEARELPPPSLAPDPPAGAAGGRRQHSGGGGGSGEAGGCLGEGRGGQPAAAADGPAAPAPLIVFASNAGGSRMFAAAAGGGGGGGGHVYVLRGLMTTRRAAGSVAAFLQHLLA